MRYYLSFLSDNYGKKEINEPFGMDSIIFSLKQRDGSMGRDVSFSGGEISFEFSHLRKHELKKLLYYNRKFGFESNVVLTIEIDSENKFECDLDFANAETDDLEYFRCKGIEDGKLQIVKARKDVKVDLTSEYDIDGNFIGQMPSTNMLLLAKPIVQTSKWEQATDFSQKFTAVGNGITSTKFFHINPCINLIESKIEDSYTFFNTYNQVQENATESDFVVLKAKDTLRNITINLMDITVNFVTEVVDGGNGYVDFSLELRHGSDFQTATKKVLISTTQTENKIYNYNGNLNETIPFLNRGDSVWIFFYIKVRQSASVPILNEKFNVYLLIKNMKTNITAESTSYNSIHKCFRLSDVMDRVVKSISGLSTNKPRFAIGGEFYDNVLLDGNLLRGINTRAVNISLDDIDKSINEMFTDWEIGSDGKIFFGRDLDFYSNTEIAFFDNIQFSGMNKTFNPKFKINEFLFKYNKFQSQKENTEAGSSDEIHGESTLTFFNKNVENKKEVEIGWIRSAFLAEEVRRKGLEISDSTSAQNDDDIFAFDIVETIDDLQFTESTELEHTKDDSSGRLILKNNGSLNFVTLGIKAGTTFLINAVDVNAGTYTVFSVENNKIELTKLSGAVLSSGNGIRTTNYTYTILKADVPLTNYTGQAFTETSGLNAPDSFSNRRYSIIRNIYNYYSGYLATANLYWKDKPLKNTWYKNNPDYTAKYNGITLKEGQELIPNNPILSPVVYNEMVFANVSFSKYIQLINNLRSSRGYIRTIDNNQQVIKVYPQELEFEQIKNELRIKAEEKFELNYMTIVDNIDYILINDETRIQTFIYDFDNDGKLYVYDENRFRLYNGVYWFEVSVNGAIPSSQIELENWLNLINN